MYNIYPEDLFREVSNKYYDSLLKGIPEFDFFLLKDEFKTQSDHPVWTTYAKEYTRTLINNFNDFSILIYRLHLLDKIIQEYSDKDQLELRREFTQMRLYCCLLRPNEFNNSLKFMSYNLCHQASRIIDPSYLDSDRQLKNTKEKMGSQHWESVKNLNRLIKDMAEFDELTQRFRHRSQHDLPPLLEIGLSNFVARDKNTSIEEAIDPDSLDILLSDLNIDQNSCAEFMASGSKVTKYRFGYAPPLTSRDMIPVLLKERDKMKKRFYAYWELVKEQDSAILNSNLKP
ncbi:MAG: hypothetical protein ACFCVD_08880 [Nodosilinea sp.]